MGLSRHGLWVALALMACTTSETQERGAANTPFCRKVQRCLREALPQRYRFDLHEQVLAKAADCLGHDARSVWTTRDCLPFEFARDEPSGIGMQVVVDCSEMCPMNASLKLRFAEPVGPFECECMGARANYEADWGQYVGCSPLSRPTRATYQHVKDAPAPDKGFVIAAARENPASQALGLTSGLPVVAIDGVALTSIEPLKQVLQHLPNELPGSIQMSTAQRADPKLPSEVELHYPSRTAFKELTRVAQEIDLAHIGEGASYCGGQGQTRGSIQFGERSVAYDRACENEATRRLSLLASAIERAAADAKPRRVMPVPAPSACKELRTFPGAAILKQKGVAIELRYVDWLAR